MRFVLSLLIFATPASAWEATVGQICTLSHETDSATIFLTYDPAQPLYSLTITRTTENWAQAPWFAMRFEGPTPIEIATSRHVLSENATALTVTDKGFGNVLDGLEYNQSAYAFTQNQIIEFPLDGAASQVRIFRECAGAHLS
ncbi:hypothetical protein [Ruegeria arenilitoris]|uniref:hypothetical protein n=1 Tax=Ruegeria arenilitoris TaxID=1173585 RepID=UPI00147E9C4E|nr:hypothetical protein [Ruegeria arenilitoris]